MREHNGIVVIGAGGHARVIISTLRAARQRIAGVYDDDESRWGQNMMGFKVQGADQPTSGLSRPRRRRRRKRRPSADNC